MALNMADLWLRFKNFVRESIRVYKVTKKPSWQEFMTTVKVSAIGIAIIGLIGFIINILWALLKP